MSPHIVTGSEHISSSLPWISLGVLFVVIALIPFLVYVIRHRTGGQVMNKKKSMILLCSGIGIAVVTLGILRAVGYLLHGDMENQSFTTQVSESLSESTHNPVTSDVISRDIITDGGSFSIHSDGIDYRCTLSHIEDEDAPKQHLDMTQFAEVLSGSVSVICDDSLDRSENRQRLSPSMNTSPSRSVPGRPDPRSPISTSEAPPISQQSVEMNRKMEQFRKDSVDAIRHGAPLPIPPM